MENNQKHWYIVQVATNKENKFKQSLQEKIEKFSLNNLFEAVLVPVLPSEEKRKKKLYPGYVFVKAELNDIAKNMINSSEGVVGFPGVDSRTEKVYPVSKREMENVFNLMGGKKDTVAPPQKFSFDIGDKVKITSGPFSNFIGSIDEIDSSKLKARITVEIFGRKTPAEFQLEQLQKIK